MPIYSVDKILQTSDVKTSTFVTVPANVEEFREGVMFIEVTAASGTGRKIIPRIEISRDQINWSEHTQMADITDVGNFNQPLTNFGKYIRVNNVISGATPSFTLSVIFVGKSGD